MSNRIAVISSTSSKGCDCKPDTSIDSGNGRENDCHNQKNWIGFVPYMRPARVHRLQRKDGYRHKNGP